LLNRIGDNDDAGAAGTARSTPTAAAAISGIGRARGTRRI
jgi:hypothetical protein